jgi:Bacterial membrane protein YfhO
MGCRLLGSPRHHDRLPLGGSPAARKPFSRRRMTTVDQRTRAQEQQARLKPARDQLRQLLARHPEILPATGVVLAVLIANLPYLTGLFDPNPINQFSGLTVHSTPGLFPGTNVIDPNAGFTSQALGHRAVLDWIHGQVPWWTPYEGVGAPLAGEMNSAAFFPLTILLWPSTGQLYFHLILEALAGAATYFLLRRLAVRRWAAWAGGVAFALNGTFAWFGHSPVNPIPFLPLLLLGAERALSASSTRRRFGWGLLAVALALSLYAGFPEVAFIDGLLVAAWVLVRAFQVRHGPWRSFLLKVASGTVCGLLLATPILLALAGYLPYGNIGGHGGAFAYAHFPPATLPHMLLPYVYGPIDGFTSYDHSGLLGHTWLGGYLTTAILLLALVGLVGRGNRHLRLLLGLWIAMALAKTFGVTWVTHAFNLIPGVSTTAFYVWAAVSWQFAAILLAALGLDDVTAGRAPRARIATATAVALGVVIAASVGALPLVHRLAAAPHHKAWAAASMAWGAAVVMAIAVIAILGRGALKAVTLSTILALDAIAMFVVPQLSAPRNAQIDTAPVRFLEANLGDGRFYTLGPIMPDYGSYFGIASVNVNDIPVPKRWTTYITTRLDTNTIPIIFTGFSRLNPNGPTAAEELVSHLGSYEAVGVKYVVLPASMPLPQLPPGVTARVAFSDKLTRIVELPTHSPYFQASGCTTQFVSRTRVTTTCPRPASLLRRELYMPGWEATINGRDTAVSESQNLFQSVTLPSGRSTVTFSYAPPHVNLAVAAFGVGALWFLWCALVPRGLRRRRRSIRQMGTAAQVRPATGPRADARVTSELPPVER